MVTRNIEKNTASQVNANLIGVLVHPDVTPGYDVVNSIIADYSYQTINVTNTYNDSSIITELDDYAYYFAAISMEVGGQNYYRWDAIDGSQWGDTLWSTDAQSQGDNLYRLDTSDPENPQMNQITEIKRVFSINGTFIRTDQSNYINTNYSGTYVVNGDFLCDATTSNKVGYCPGDLNTVIAEDMTFVKGSTSGDYQTWTNDDLVSEGFDTRSLYTVAENPQIGDTAYFNVEDLTFNPQTVKNVVVEHFPPVPDPVECVVSYSVDGETFTVHPTTLTDDNNVICNIPRYVYLKFSQDVTITEE